MNFEKIKTILLGTEETLKLLYEHPDYQKIEECHYFNTVDDVRLIDAIKLLHHLSDGVSALEERLCSDERPRHHPSMALTSLQGANTVNPPTDDDDDDDIPF